MIGSEELVGGWNGALISGDMKLILGLQSYGFWQGPVFPNATTNPSNGSTFDCGAGCLFNITEDPSEHVDLSKVMPKVLSQMQQLFRTRNQTTFQARPWGRDATTCAAFVDAHHGFVGPYLTPTNAAGGGGVPMSTYNY